MDREAVLDYCLGLPGSWEDEPWDGDVVVKVGSKIFAFFGSFGTNDDGIGLKCGRNRDDAGEWLDRYPDDALPMPYLARSGWNTLRIGGAIPDDDLLEAIDASYASRVAVLPKRERPPLRRP